MQVNLQVQETPVPPPPAKKRITRRRFLRALAGTASLAGGGAVYATQVEPFWLDAHDVAMPIANLPPSFEGFRIAQLTDLHAGDSVPLDHLRRAVKLVNDAKPDCVVVTGDLVTHAPEWIDPISQVLAELTTPVYVTFGNHDYDPRNAEPGPVTIIADALEQNLTARGCTVLRNRAVSIERAGDRIWLVGLEDLYTTRFLPDLAFAGAAANETRICLSHNPDGTDQLLPHKPDLILSGHTHGGQVRLPFWGAILLPTSDKHLDQGQFILPRGQLYVSRGVGFLARVRLNCRPEIPTFVLTRQA